MDITCDIIRDLLPLYAEDLVSEDSKTLVEEHLCNCEPCTKQLGILEKATALPIEVETKSIKRVGDIIRRKRVLAVLTALGILGTLIFGATMFLNAKVYLPADQAIIKVEAKEDGSIQEYLSTFVTGTGSVGEAETENYGVIAYTRMEKLLAGDVVVVPYEGFPAEELLKIHEKLSSTHTMQLPGGAVNHNIWYINAKDGTGEMLLWDAGHDYDGTPFCDVNYHIAYYVVIMAALCAVSALASLFLKKPRLKELTVRLAIVFGSLSLSTVIVTAGQFMELWGEFTEAVMNGVALAVPMALTCIAVRQLYLLNQQEKGL